MRIGDGGLADKEAVKREARGLYLLAIAEEAPSVLQELARETLPLYRRMYLLSRRDETASDLRLHDWISLSKLSKQESDFRPVHRVVGAWARRHNLRNAWIRDAALETLHKWCRILEQRDPVGLSDEPRILTWQTPLVSQELNESGGDIGLRFEDEGWDYLNETRTEAKKRLLGEFKKFLSEYLGEVEERFRRDGWESPYEKKSLWHFNWLARYQVLGRSYSTIARDDGTGARESVQEAVRKTAELADVRLRQQRGRPKGSKTENTTGNIVRH